MEASPFIVVRVNWVEGYPCSLHYYLRIGVMVRGCYENGERLQQCNTEPFIHRFLLKEIQDLGHSSGSIQLESMNGSHSAFGLSSVLDSQMEVIWIMVIVQKCGN